MQTFNEKLREAISSAENAGQSEARIIAEHLRACMEDGYAEPDFIDTTLQEIEDWARSLRTQLKAP